MQVELNLSQVTVSHRFGMHACAMGGTAFRIAPFLFNEQKKIFFKKGFSLLQTSCELLVGCDVVVTCKCF